MDSHFLIIILDCIGIAVLAGLISGIFGGGSGLIMVPGFFYVLQDFHLNEAYLIQMAIATTCATSSFLGILSTRVQWRQNQIDFAAFKQLIPGMTVGSIFAVILLNIISSELLKKLFGVLVLVVGIWFILYQQEKDTKLWSLYSKANYFFSTLIALFWFLLGAAVFTTPYLHKCGLDFRRAIGTATLNSTVFSAIMAILLILTGWHQIGITKQHLGFISIPLFLSAAIPSSIAAHYGSQISIWLPKKYLKSIYACLIFIIGVLMLV